MHAPRTLECTAHVSDVPASGYPAVMETEQIAHVLAVLEDALGGEVTVVKVTTEEITVMATLPSVSEDDEAPLRDRRW